MKKKKHSIKAWIHDKMNIKEFMVNDGHHTYPEYFPNRDFHFWKRKLGCTKHVRITIEEL